MCVGVARNYAIHWALSALLTLWALFAERPVILTQCHCHGSRKGRKLRRCWSWGAKKSGAESTSSNQPIQLDSAAWPSPLQPLTPSPATSPPFSPFLATDNSKMRSCAMATLYCRWESRELQSWLTFGRSVLQLRSWSCSDLNAAPSGVCVGVPRLFVLLCALCVSFRSVWCSSFSLCTPMWVLFAAMLAAIFNGHIRLYDGSSNSRANPENGEPSSAVQLTYASFTLSRQTPFGPQHKHLHWENNISLGVILYLR